MTSIFVSKFLFHDILQLLIKLTTVHKTLIDLPLSYNHPFIEGERLLRLGLRVYLEVGSEVASG